MKADFSESPSRLKRLLYALGLATFIQVLDVSIANVAIPRIAADFAVSTGAGIWLITAFTVANGIAILMAGWLARRYGDGRTFIGATFAFCLASLLCGLSWSFEALLVSRCLQGFAAGPILPLSQSLLVRHFPASERVRALSVWSSIAVAAPIFGPLAGGVIVDHFAWQWIFLINVAVGLLAIYLIRDLPGMEAAPVYPRFDRLGFAAIVVIVCGLQLLAAASLLSLVLPFLALGGLLLWRIEVQTAQPIVNMHILRDRDFVLGTAVLGGGYALFYCNLVLVPLWLQHSQGLSATEAGLATAPIGVLPLLLTPLVARWFERFDKRYWAFLSFFFFGLTSLWLAVSEADAWTLGGLRFLQGFALAIFYVPLFSLATQALEDRQVGDASVQITFVRYTLAAWCAPLALAFCANLPDEQAMVFGAGPAVASEFFRMTDFFLLSAGVYFMLCIPVFFFGSIRQGRVAPHS